MQVSVEKFAGSNIPGLEMTKLVSDSSFALAIFMFITIMEWDCPLFYVYFRYIICSKIHLERPVLLVMPTDSI